MCLGGGVRGQGRGSHSRTAATCVPPEPGSGGGPRDPFQPFPEDHRPEREPGQRADGEAPAGTHHARRPSVF